MLNNYGKLDYDGHVCQGVTYHQLHSHQNIGKKVPNKYENYSYPKLAEVGSQIRRKGHLTCTIQGFKPPFFYGFIIFVSNGNFCKYAVKPCQSRLKTGLMNSLGDLWSNNSGFESEVSKYRNSNVEQMWKKQALMNSFLRKHWVIHINQRFMRNQYTNSAKNILLSFMHSFLREHWIT